MGKGGKKTKENNEWDMLHLQRVSLYFNNPFY